MKGAILLFIVCAIGTCIANPVDKIEKIGVIEQQTVTITERAKYEEELLRKLNNKCSQNDVSSCVMLKLVTYMNKLLKKASIELTDDIEIKKINNQNNNNEEILTTTTTTTSYDTGRSGDDETEFMELVTSKIYAFIKSRSIKWRVLPEDDVVVSATEDENGSFNLGLSIERADASTPEGKIFKI